MARLGPLYVLSKPTGTPENFPTVRALNVGAHGSVKGTKGCGLVVECQIRPCFCQICTLLLFGSCASKHEGVLVGFLSVEVPDLDDHFKENNVTATRFKDQPLDHVEGLMIQGARSK